MLKSDSSNDFDQTQQETTENSNTTTSTSTSTIPTTVTFVPPQVTPNHPSGVYIIWSDKYNPERGYNPLTLSSTKFNTAMQEFINDEVSYRATACAIIEVLFERDFSGDGKHWDSPCTYASLVKRHDSGAESWDVERYSDWDWKDINARARSHAIITMSGDKKRIRLDNYSFYCAG